MSSRAARTSPFGFTAQTAASWLKGTLHKKIGDKIQVIAKDIGFPTAAANGDVTFTVGSGKLVIKGGADKPIRLYGANGGELAQRYTP